MLPIHATFYICPALSTKSPSFSCLKRNACLGAKSRTPKNPSLLPQNRFKMSSTIYLRGKNKRSTMP